MKTVLVKSTMAYIDAFEWCTKNLGYPGYRWDREYIMPWYDGRQGLTFKNTEDYVLFMLTVGAELGFVSH